MILEQKMYDLQRWNPQLTAYTSHLFRENEKLHIQLGGRKICQ